MIPRGRDKALVSVPYASLNVYPYEVAKPNGAARGACWRRPTRSTEIQAFTIRRLSLDPHQGSTLVVRGYLSVFSAPVPDLSAREFVERDYLLGAEIAARARAVVNMQTRRPFHGHWGSTLASKSRPTREATVAKNCSGRRL
jgi:hypothetical protein